MRYVIDKATGLAVPITQDASPGPLEVRIDLLTGGLIVSQEAKAHFPKTIEAITRAMEEVQKVRAEEAASKAEPEAGASQLEFLIGP